MRQLKFGNVILCDYAAPGHGNKHIIVNSYSGNIKVASFPVNLQLGLYVELLPFSGRPTEFAMEFKLGGKKVAKLDVKLEDVVLKEVAAIVIPAFGLRIDGPSVLNVFGSAEGFGRKKILSKSIN